MAVTALSGQRWQGEYGTTYPASDWTEIGNEWTLTGNQIDFALKRDGAYSTATIDTGSNISDTWVLRMHVNFTGNSSGDNYAYQAFWGFSSQPSNYYWSDTQDTAGFLLHFAGTGGSGDNRFAVSEGDNTTLEGDSSVTVSGHTVTPTGEWYIELKRTASTTITLGLYTDATYGTLVSGTSVTSNTNFSGTGLRYLKFGTPNYSSQAEIQNGTVDTVEFYDNMTTATGTPTNKFLSGAADEKSTVTDVPVGSEFEQTDDYKSYQYGGYPSGLGSSANGTNSGSTLNTSEEKLGTGCLEFDGSNDYVSLGTDSGFNLLNGGTVAMWVNTDNITDRRLAGKGSNGAWELLSETTNNVLKFRVNDGSVENVVGTTALSDGTWYHVAGVYDKSAGEIRLYVNGALENTTTGIGQIATVGTATYLGRNEGGNYYDGLIDDVGFWNTVLPIGTDEDTAGSIKWLYNTGTGRLASTIPTGLLAYYNCDSLTMSNSIAGWVERGTAI